MPGRGTKKRPIRVEDDLWLPYLKLCQDEGTSASEDIREHIRARLRSREPEQEEHTDGQG